MKKAVFRGAVFEAARRPKTDTTKNRPCFKLLIESPDPNLMVKQRKERKGQKIMKEAQEFFVQLFWTSLNANTYGTKYIFSRDESDGQE